MQNLKEFEYMDVVYVYRGFRPWEIDFREKIFKIQTWLLRVLSIEFPLCSHAIHSWTTIVLLFYFMVALNSVWSMYLISSVLRVSDINYIFLEGISFIIIRAQPVSPLGSMWLVHRLFSDIFRIYFQIHHQGKK